MYGFICHAQSPNSEVRAFHFAQHRQGLPAGRILAQPSDGSCAQSLGMALGEYFGFSIHGAIPKWMFFIVAKMLTILSKWMIKRGTPMDWKPSLI